MTSRGRVSSSGEWDAMRDEFNDSARRFPYPEEDSEEKPRDYTKLYVTKFSSALAPEGLVDLFKQYGNVVRSYVSKDPQKRYAFISYESAGEANIAMTKLNRAEPFNMHISYGYLRNESAVNASPNVRSQSNSEQISRQHSNIHHSVSNTDKQSGRHQSVSNLERQTTNKYPSTDIHSGMDNVSNTDNQCGRHQSVSNLERQSTNRYPSTDKRSSIDKQSPSMSKPASRMSRSNQKIREDFSMSSESKPRHTDDHVNGEEMETEGSDSVTDPKFVYNLEQIKLQRLQVKEQQLMVQERLLIQEQKMKNNNSTVVTKRRILPGGSIQVTLDETRFIAGAGDSNDTTCSCQKTSWTRENSGSSTPSTCVLCSEDPSPLSKLETENSKTDLPDVEESKTTMTVSKSKHSEYSKVSRRSDATSKKCVARKCTCRISSNITCDLKFRDFYAETDNDDADETNRLIQMRNSDYLDIVDHEFKLVIALAGYPKSKMRLRHMELFQRCLREVIETQSKGGLLNKDPSFHDYYLNRGAVVCICKDLETRDWLVRICPGLQERMCYNLILLNSDVKRLCLAVLKIPRSCWPATAQDVFKLLQYFNPSLKTAMWKIYSQKSIDDVECTSFLIDRVSGEIIRGPTFKNVIDYDQMEFELTGYTEIYYECLLACMDEDLSSVASRVKLLEEIKSAKTSPRLESTVCLVPLNKLVGIQENPEVVDIGIDDDFDNNEESKPQEVEDDEEIDDSANRLPSEVEIEEIEFKKELEHSIQDDLMNKMKDVQYIGEHDEILAWSDHTEEKRNTEKKEGRIHSYLETETTTTSLMAFSEKSASIIESNDNLLTKTSTINIDSNRGIAYHRRTNYLHVEPELKVAITLEGYPVNKLEGTHIRRLKHLFKEYLHKDLKSQRFTNMIIPKFQDIYLSNGAVIYICDSLETIDYLTEILPKFISSSGLKLMFRDVKNLVRYTRTVMRLPKEQAHVESVVILTELQTKYPKLNPACWKYYSDVAGKQKREFGVDPESLEVIKNPTFDPIYDGEKLTFRIIDRQKRDISCDKASKSGDNQTLENKKYKEYVVKNMYTPIDPEIMPATLTRIRTNHYTDLIADDLKLYVGPSNYPDCRIDEVHFHTVRKTLEVVVAEALEKGAITEDEIPKFHDMYLFDGVIFIICHNMESRVWIENNIDIVNEKCKTSLKSTEFRGAVGIVSLVAKTSKETDEVIAILQKQNPRLRSKFWRKISTVRTSSKIDAVLQIDKLSAQVIMDPEFNRFIDPAGVEPAEFKLGHLRSLIKPKESLEELTKAKTLKVKKKGNKSKKISKKKSREITKHDHETEDKAYYSDLDNSPKILEEYDPETIILKPQSPKHSKDFVVPDNCYQTKIVLKVPTNILPDSEDDLNIIFDILEDKNPGLNTEIWQIYSETDYPCNGKFFLYVDNQSLAIIQSKDFVPIVGGERLKFFF